MSSFRLAEIGRLAHELALSPRDLRLRQIAGAQRLLDLIEADKEYPYAFVCFHVTGYRPRGVGDAGLSGRTLIEDITLLIDRLSESEPAATWQVREPIHTPEDLAARFRVSTRTIARWRQRGLAALWFVFDDGQTRCAVPDSALRRFVRRNLSLVQRAGSFCVMDASERQRIIDRARELLAEEPRSMHALSKVLAAETSRATETIRLLLRRHDVERPDEALFPEEIADPFDATSIAAAHRDGESVEAIAERLGQDVDAVEGSLRDARTAELTSASIDYVYFPEFDLPNAADLILRGPGDSPVEAPWRQSADRRVPSQLPAYLAALYRVPLLTPAGEQHLFRQYNFLKHQAEQVRKTLRADSPNADDVARVEALLASAARVKNEIVQANLRLVVSIAKRHARQCGGMSLFELISEGNMALLRAVEKFDAARGFRFSTYATWAVSRHFARAIPDEYRQSQRYQTGQDERLKVERDDDALSEESAPSQPGRLRQILVGGMSQLDPRERRVIERHFGLSGGGAPATLEEIGRELGVSKERARQIKERALLRLRSALAPEAAHSLVEG